MAKKKGHHRHPPRGTVGREDRYMGLAWMWASMSKDPSTQVGCVIISADNRPLGSGYNGPPRLFRDEEINWVRPDKYPYIRHAERNALDFCSEKPRGATLYVTAPPCKDCILDIAEAGISRVIFQRIPNYDLSSMISREEDWEITKDIAKKGIVGLVEYTGNLNWMRDWNEELYRKGAFG
jgi:dCMP deaminase